MGDCQSRPTEDRVQTHIKLSSSRHDFKFYSAPVVPPYIDNIKFKATSDPQAQELMRVQLAKLQFDIGNLVSSKDRYKPQLGQTLKPVVLAEVQKGADLFFDMICLQSPKPLVEVTTEPSGTKLVTFAGEAVIPTWFSFFNLPVPPTATTLVFKVLCERNIGGQMELGRFEVSLDELRDSKIRDDWYPIATSKKFGPDEVPRLKLRFQFVSDIGELMAAHAKICEDGIRKATAAHERLKGIVNSMIDYLLLGFLVFVLVFVCFTIASA